MLKNDIIQSYCFHALFITYSGDRVELLLIYTIAIPWSPRWRLLPSIPLGYEHCLVSGSYLCMCTTSQSYVLFWFLLAALVGSKAEFYVLLLLKNQRSKLVFISELPTFISSYYFCLLWPYFGLACQLSLYLYQKTWILPSQEIKTFGKNTPYLLDGYAVAGYGSDQPGSPCNFVPIN